MVLPRSITCLAPLLLALNVASAHGANAEGLELFEKSIRPIFVQHCIECHSTAAGKAKGGLRLDSQAAWSRGGDSGPAVVPGSPEKSLLLHAVKQLDLDLQMPPKKTLQAREIADLEKWIALGAPDPREETGGVVLTEAAGIDLAKGKTFWSLQPVKSPVIPAGNASNSGIIDRFIDARLAGRNLTPNSEADRRTLLRRAWYDLTGLPPTPAEMRRFLADPSPDAFDRVVDRLLSSPAYGERWGRHWLDVVRYADTSGCNADVPIPEAYRYRNWVIQAFNSDMPYDQFIQQQIAGDLLPFETEAQHHQQIIATGYLAISRRFSSLGEEPHLTLDDTLDNVGKGVLGLTLSCARCHDHKFDPIAAADYYALYGIFESTRYSFPGTEIPRHPRDAVPLVSQERLEREIRPYQEAVAKVDAEMDAIYARKVSLDSGEEQNAVTKLWQNILSRRDALTRSAPDYEKAFAVTEGRPQDSPIQLKGDPKKPGRQVRRGFLAVLGGQTLPSNVSGSGRLQLAQWLTAKENPLTARVMVNRLWLHHFGQGLVRTPNDFGTRGLPPTHPELLDYLALRFMESGWSLKALHREMMLSQAYRRSSDDQASALEQDPTNEWLWRMDRRRLSAEEIRDAMLQCASQLDRSQGGRHPFKPEWQWGYTQHHPFVDDFPSQRRSLYLLTQRIRSQPSLAVYDAADPNASTGQRPLSTTAMQALQMMNAPFTHEQAAAFARRMLDAAATDKRRIQLAYETALSREPSNEEIAEGLEFLESAMVELDHAPLHEDRQGLAAWASYLRVLLSSNEFIFLD